MSNAGATLMEVFDGFAAAQTRVTPSYCNYLAHRIESDFRQPDPERLIVHCTDTKAHLHPEGGYLVSTTRILEVEDRNGKCYRVTVEEVRP